MDNNAKLPPTIGTPDDKCCHEPVPTYEFNQAILASKVMLTAYACAVVILALGLVALTIMLAYLAFWYPDKAQPFIYLLGGPMATLFVAHTLQLPKLVKRVILVKKDSE